MTDFLLYLIIKHISTVIKIGCAFILSLFFACSVSAQQVIGNKKDSIPKNCIYAEGGEYAERTALDGFYYSVNYARVFHEKDEIKISLLLNPFFRFAIFSAIVI